MNEARNRPWAASGLDADDGSRDGGRARARAGAGALARRFALPAAVAAALAAGWATGWFDQVALSNLIRHREALLAYVESHLLLALAAYFLLYAGLVAISFPGASLLTVAAGFLFGGPVGAAVTVCAATLGAVAIFLVARSSFGSVLEERASGFASRLADGFRRDAFSYLLSLRLTPIFPFWVVNIVPAMLNMRLRPYALATFLGIIPGTFAYAYVGAGLGSVIDAQEAANPGCAAAGTCSIDPASLVTGQMLLAFAGLGVVALLPAVLRRAGLFGGEGR